MKLALLGRSISHSLSPRIYRELTGDTTLDYVLIDVSSEQSIPDIRSLFLRDGIQGISVTAPYKAWAARHCDPPSELPAVNALRMRQDRIQGINTDEMAFREILNELRFASANAPIVLLGAGVMAKMAERVFREKGASFTTLSRNQGYAMDFVDLDTEGRPLFVINACAREYSFDGRLPQGTVFWDLNYSHSFHEKHIPELGARYLDGIDLLRRQAIHALHFFTDD